MPILFLIIFLVLFWWLLIRLNQLGKRRKPPAFFRQMKNTKPIPFIKLNRQKVVVGPRAKVVMIRPDQPIVVKPTPAISVQPKSMEVISVRPQMATTVIPPERGAWDDRGWIRKTIRGRETYEGYYLVGKRRFHGRIEASNRGRNITAYILNPPREVKNHPHGACFQLVGDGWFHLHWSNPARNVDDAILYMERILDESLKG